MCVVSQVLDTSRDWMEQEHPWIKRYPKYPFGPQPITIPDITMPKDNSYTVTTVYATKHELEALRNEVKLIKEMISTAIKYDERTNQPHCEDENKVKIVKFLQELTGIDMSDVLEKLK